MDQDDKTSLIFNIFGLLAVLVMVIIIWLTKPERSLDSDCGICSVEFKEGDACRILPACKHMFHVDCVDARLNQGRWCPKCRTLYAPIEIVPFKKGMKLTAAPIGYNAV